MHLSRNSYGDMADGTFVVPNLGENYGDRPLQIVCDVHNGTHHLCGIQKEQLQVIPSYTLYHAESKIKRPSQSTLVCLIQDHVQFTE